MQVPPDLTERERELITALRWLLDDLVDAEEDRNPETGEEYVSVKNAANLIKRIYGVSDEKELLAKIDDVMNHQLNEIDFTVGAWIAGNMDAETAMTAIDDLLRKRVDRIWDWGT
jgi:hypothetical protein